MISILIQKSSKFRVTFLHDLGLIIRHIIYDIKKDCKMIDEELTSQILACAFKIHTGLGPGLLESAYEACLFYELKKAGIYVEKQKPCPLIYDEVKMDIGYRIDLMVESKVIVEIKAVEAIHDVHVAQTITYLKLTNCKVGLLLNFYVKHLKDGIKRIII